MNLGIFYFSLASLVVSPGSGVTQDVPPSATGSALLEQCRRGAPECGAYLQGIVRAFRDRSTPLPDIPVSH